MPCGSWLAWARIEVPACCRMLLRVNPTISSAMSASRIRLSEAVRFSDWVARFSMVCSRRFWTAPRFDRFADTSEIASSSDWISCWALVVFDEVAKVDTAAARFAKPPPAPNAPAALVLTALVIELSIETEIVWFAFAPTWNDAAAEPAAVTIVSFTAIVRSDTIAEDVAAAVKPDRLNDTPRVLKFNCWELEPVVVIAETVSVCEIVAPPMVAVMVIDDGLAAVIVKVVPAWAPDT